MTRAAAVVGAAGTPPVYDRIGIGYRSVRRPDPRWSALIRAAIGEGRSVVNVGAGAGSYEPVDVPVTAVEPSMVMIAQRPAGAAPCVAGRAEALPFDDGAFDVALAVLTVHHWADLARGIAELHRVARRYVIVSYDMDVQDQFWLTRDYIPKIADAEHSRVPALATLQNRLPGSRVEPLPISADFTDGFMTAFWQRPHAYLDPAVRRSCSAFALTDRDAVERGIASLRSDLASGAWERRFRHLRALSSIDAGFRLITGTSRPDSDWPRP